MGPVQRLRRTLTPQLPQIDFNQDFDVSPLEALWCSASRMTMDYSLFACCMAQGTSTISSREPRKATIALRKILAPQLLQQLEDRLGVIFLVVETAVR